MATTVALDRAAPPRHKARYENDDLHLLLRFFLLVRHRPDRFRLPQGQER
ncbi:hypothetical protein G6M64_21190 [Agrobacterium tumefaciens]|jgi:hypothetical protein|nr:MULTISPECIES: hypothetical protein [Agrobacterium]NSY95123.1 hypothetical protein [Agrobacterium tumefaciens]NSZ38920.1 hypothetical protein [Agrobacterium tumefaciens]NTC41875.1 hypothetical protein [Agrobacterium tumefaciens]WLD97662.1 hypothetical protein PX860_03965 [Agrobacterium leguminum]